MECLIKPAPGEQGQTYGHNDDPEAWRKDSLWITPTTFSVSKD